MSTPKSTRRHRIPRVAIIADTAIAILLFGTGLYHFTQPHQAWRSGTIEVVAAASLIAAAYVVDRIKAMLIQVAVLLTICGLGIRHLIRWEGWRSGSTELLIAAVLVAVTVITYRHKPGRAKEPGRNNRNPQT
jgi:hypothetical protein